MELKKKENKSENIMFVIINLSTSFEGYKINPKCSKFQIAQRSFKKCIQ